MILQALYELAKHERLTEDADFEPKAIAWLVRVSPEGRVLGIEGTKNAIPEQSPKKKPKLVAKTFQLPRERPVTSGDRAFLLFNKAEYVFGIDPNGTRDAGKLRRRFDLFRQKVKDCLDATDDEGVRAVATLLDEIAAGRQNIALPPDCVANDLFAFIYSPDVDKLVTDRTKVRAYWKQLRAKESGSGERQVCLVSGVSSEPVELFPQLKRVPGGTTSGISLVSFNKNAFESYGWEGNANAPVSREAAESCATALNRLLDSSYPDPKQLGQTLPQRNLRLSSNTVVCFWSPEPSAENFCSVFVGLLEANPDTVKELYRSIWNGTMPHIEDKSAFYALTLSGTQGRAIVRDWFESTVTDVAMNLGQHFADLQIVRITPKPRAKDLPPQFALSMLLRSLAVQGDSERVPPPLVADLVEAALHGTLYPFSILQRAVERARAEIGRDEWIDLARRDARVALIKAVLNRRRRLLPATVQYQEVMPEMNPNNSSEGYALGLLMAVLEEVQRKALGEPSASVVDRYFSGASANPKTVFVRLLKNARHHVSKASGMEQKGWHVSRLERIIDELACHFDPKHNGFPSFLNIEQQGLFILGYHQMRKWLRMSREERTEWETNHSNVPRAFIWNTRAEEVRPDEQDSIQEDDSHGTDQAPL
ncbi:MAG: type I-C CRISPR-associated protein Cas8c/Csd1 [Candidatus Acidiferrales bacterium]